jgi:hypothetical protein
MCSGNAACAIECNRESAGTMDEKIANTGAMSLGVLGRP